MIYHYACNVCGNRKDVECPMGLAPKEILCNCGGKMVQDILGKRIQNHLPLDYRATEAEYHSVNYGDDEDMEKMLSI